MRNSFWLLILAASVSIASGQPTRKVSFPMDQQVEQLVAGGDLELISVDAGVATALFTDRSRTGGPALSALRGLKVLSPDIDQELAAFRARGNVGLYHTAESTAAELREVAARYPALCHLESIGKTFEGRDIWALRITGAADPAAVPRMLLFGLTHAREWISAELPFFVIHQLLDGYATEPAIRKLVDGRCLWIVPVLNPDGLAYSQSQYKMWRKNRSRRGPSTGVDVNRNFEVGFGTGSSDAPTSDVYHGPAANSEEETRALLALVKREKFHVSLSLHSYSELILYPWGYSKADPPGKSVLAGHGRAMGKLNGYRPGSVAQILYDAGGASDDTFLARHGCWAWTFELGTEFVPPDSQIKSICQKNWPAVRHLIEASAELATTPPPTSGAASVDERLATLERAFLDSALVSPGIDPLGELVATVQGQLPEDRALAAEVERRAAVPAWTRLYAPLLGLPR